MNSIHKSNAARTFAVLALATLPLSLNGQTSASDIDAIEAQIKAPDSPEARSATVALTKEIRKAIPAVGSREPMRAANKIWVQHNRSLLEEAFHHLNQIRPYADYEELFKIESIRSIALARDRLERNEINSAQFQNSVDEADAVYDQDVQDARTYLNEKIDRLKSICKTYGQNGEALQENLGAMKIAEAPPELARRVIGLRSETTWLDFTGCGTSGSCPLDATPTENGEQMRRAITQARPADLATIVSCMATAFDAYLPRRPDVLAEEVRVEEVADQYR